MYETARFIENCIEVLVEEAEEHGLAEVARLLKLASDEARELVALFDQAPEASDRLHLH